MPQRRMRDLQGRIDAVLAQYADADDVPNVVIAAPPRHRFNWIALVAVILLGVLTGVTLSNYRHAQATPSSTSITCVLPAPTGTAPAP